MYSVFFPSIFWPISGHLKIRPFVKLDQKFLFTTTRVAVAKNKTLIRIAFYSLLLAASLKRGADAQMIQDLKLLSESKSYI